MKHPWIVLYYDRTADQIGIRRVVRASRANARRTQEDGGVDRIHVVAYSAAEWDRLLEGAGIAPPTPATPPASPTPPPAAPTAYRVRWVYEPEPDLHNPEGSPLPGPESEYTGNEIRALIDPAGPEDGARRIVPYAEYCEYWGNPDRHTVIACTVDVQCGPCGSWSQAAALWNIDMMDDDPELRGVPLGQHDYPHKSEYLTPDQAVALPGYLGEVARDLLAEAGRS